MELVVRKNDLLRELQLFQGIVERKNTIPILANVLMEAGGEEVRLLATDLEVGLRSRCSASVSKSGALTLPAKKFYEIIKSLPETDIRIAEDKGGVKVAADRFDSRMQTLPREDFPTLPESTGADSATLPREVLKQMVAKTQFAITGEDTRYFLNGALFIQKPDMMSLVATDGHRLALISVPREKVKGKKGDEEERVILPRKTLLEMGRLLAEGEGDIRYKRGEFDRDRLTSAVKRVALLSNERSRAVKFQIDKGKVEIASSSPEFGEAKEVLIVDYAPAPVTICFNAQYVLDFLAVVETDSVSLEFKDEMSQAVMKPIGADGYEYTYVIMPMRV